MGCNSCIRNWCWPHIQRIWYSPAWVRWCSFPHIRFRLFYVWMPGAIYYVAIRARNRRRTVHCAASGCAARCGKGQIFADCLLATFSAGVVRTVCLPARRAGNGWKPVGLDATVALVWNGADAICSVRRDFLPVYYRTACKVGRAFLVAALPMVLMMAVAESVAHIPALAWMDGTEPGELRRQIPILLLGVLVYGGALSLAYRRSVQNFSRVDL